MNNDTLRYWLSWVLLIGFACIVLGSATLVVLAFAKGAAEGAAVLIVVGIIAAIFATVAGSEL